MKEECLLCGAPLALRKTISVLGRVARFQNDWFVENQDATEGGAAIMAH